MRTAGMRIARTPSATGPITSHATHLAPDPRDQPEASAPRVETLGAGKPRRVGATVVAGVLLLIVACVLVWTWIARAANPPRPASAEVVGDALRVLDADGRVLWEHRFDFPLTDAAYANRVTGYDRPPIVVADVDGDGGAETLFVAEPWLPGGQGLFCFNSDGSLRFHHVPARVVKFGEKSYAPPWRGISVYVSGPAGGPRDIWFIATHLEEFPTVLEKLDAAGRVTGEYWSNGQIAIVKPELAGGRPLVFVGSINNEFKGASLAVLDAQHPSGSAPAMSDEYRCAGCPAGGPLAFLVFPRLDVTAALGTHPHVSNAFVDQTGQVLIDVAHDVGDGVPQELRTNATTHYRLDAQFRVIGAELGEKLQPVHELFERKGLLDHPYSREREDRYLWPVRRWGGSGFVEITRPESPAGR